VTNLSVSSDIAMMSALKYAQHGLFVFPIYEPAADLNGCSCRNGQNCNSSGKHPRTHTGFKAASRNEEQIKKWWTKYPNANIGIATGKASNVVVVDIDDRNGGPDTLEALLIEVGEPLPITLTAITGAGIHYYFRAPAQPLRSQNGALGTGIDVKAEGGYVVAPPSQHPSGRNYEFIDPDAQIAPLPSWIADRLDAGTPNDVSVSEDTDIAEGHRNTTLTSMAGRLRQMGAELSEVLATLHEVNRNRCKPPLGEYEVDTIAKNVCQYAAGKWDQGIESQAMTSTNPLWWFPMDTRWWHENQNIRLMDAEQRGWYITLLITAWPKAGRLPAEKSALATLADAKSPKVFDRKSELVLAEFERRNIDGVDYRIHPLLEQQYSTKLGRLEQAKQAGIASAAKRKKRNEGASA
jgi:uncharacterized protein YdaU (DUF1376 family)